MVGITNHGWLNQLSVFGWPFVHLESTKSRGISPIVSPEFTFDWRRLPLFGNVLTCLLLVISTAFVCERWTRSRRHLQFGLLQLLSLPSILGTLIALTHEWEVPSRTWADTTFYCSVISWSDLSQPVRWPIWIAIAATIYAFGCSVLSVCTRAFFLLRRSPHAMPVVPTDP